MVILKILFSEHISIKHKLISLTLYPCSFFIERCDDYLNYLIKFDDLGKEAINLLASEIESMKKRIVEDVNVSYENLDVIFKSELESIRLNIKKWHEDKQSLLLKEVKDNHGDNFLSLPKNK